jgi:hypothetical protein
MKISVLLSLILAFFPLDFAAADPTVYVESFPLEGEGLTRHIVGVEFDDGFELIAWVELDFFGNFIQLQTSEGMDVDEDSQARLYDLADDGYDMEFDSFFLTERWLTESSGEDLIINFIDGGSPGSMTYSVLIAHNPGAKVTEVEVASLLLPSGESFTFEGNIARNGVEYQVVPEPAGPAGSLAALLALASLRHVRKTRTWERVVDGRAPAR